MEHNPQHSSLSWPSKIPGDFQGKTKPVITPVIGRLKSMDIFGKIGYSKTENCQEINTHNYPERL